MKSRWAIGALAALVLLFVSTAAFRAAQAPQSAAQVPQSPGAKKAAEVYKNVQVLKEATPDEFSDSMFAMAEALGASCDFCHVQAADGRFEMDKDDKRTKKTTRAMVLLTQVANREGFEGERGPVGCVTCHVGKPRPMTAPPIRPLGAPAAGQRPPGVANPGAQGAQVAGAGGRSPQNQQQAQQQSQQAAAETLDRYVQQLGGPALEKIAARQARGTLVAESGASMPFELFQKRDKFLLGVQSPAGASSQVFNNGEGWMSSAGQSRDARGIELDRLRREAELFPAVDVRQKYQRISLGGADKVGERDAVVVQAVGQNGNRERLLFDKATGLLLRREVYHRTIVGMMPEQTEYRDYRDVDGVKVPFEIIRTEAGARWTEKYTELKHNADIDDSKFEKPAAK